MKKILKKTAAAAAATAAAGGMALGLATGAGAVAAGYEDVTADFVSYDAPGAFNPGPNPVIVSPAYGTATAIGCKIDQQGIYRTCYQEGWGHEPHQMHYVATINGHPTWVTVDLPQGFTVPQLPVIELPPGSVAGSIGNIVAGSSGSTAPAPGAGLNLDITSSLGNIGLGLGTGSAG